MAKNLARNLFFVSVDGHINKLYSKEKLRIAKKVALLMTRKFTHNYVAVAYFGFYMNLKKETEEMLITRQFLYIQNDTGNMGYLE